MKFFDRFFGSRNPEEPPQEPEREPEDSRQPEEAQPPAQPDFRQQEHIAKALSVLLTLHKEKKSDESLMGILRGLMENPPVWVPMVYGCTGIPEVMHSETGERVLPIFTSMDQVADSYRQQCSWEQMRFLDLKPYITRKAGLTGILINGFSHEFLLHRMTFPMFFQQEAASAGAVPQTPQKTGSVGVVPHTLQENKVFQLTPAGKEADCLKAAAVRFLSTHNCQKAYFGKLNNNGEESYLFAIEQNACPDREFFRLMHQELSAIHAPLPIDYTPYKSFSKHITPDNCQMIYHQGSQEPLGI